jgi:hypothetical protein
MLKLAPLVVVLAVAVADCVFVQPCSAAEAAAPLSEITTTNRATELATLSDGRVVPGRLTWREPGGFGFQPQENENDPGAGFVPLEQLGLITREVEHDRRSPRIAPPLRAFLGGDQRLSGRLVELTAQTAVMERDADDSARAQRVVLDRAGLIALAQRAGEALVWEEGFDDPALPGWIREGQAPVVVSGPLDDSGQAGQPNANPADSPGIAKPLTGSGALRITSVNGMIRHRLAQPLRAGRLELAFGERVRRAPNRRWMVELVFRESSAAVESKLQVILGWSEETVLARSEQGPGLGVQRLNRRGGWRRLAVSFGPRGVGALVDGRELARGGPTTGPLAEVRIVADQVGVVGSEGPESVAFVDDLRLVKSTEPLGRPQLDPQQDSVRMVSGDQLFGTILHADDREATLEFANQMLKLAWSDLAELRFRARSHPARPLEGSFVRVEWQVGPEPSDLDRLEGVLEGLDDTTLTLATNRAGSIVVPRDRLRKLQPLGRSWRWVLEDRPRHVGDDDRPDLDPPAPEGASLEWSFTWDGPPNPPPTLVFDVLDLVGEANALYLSDLVRDGGMRANLLLNGQPIDYLNRYVQTRNDRPERLRIPLPPNALQPGPNTLHIKQTGTKDDPNNLDDWILLQMFLERELDNPHSQLE